MNQFLRSTLAAAVAVGLALPLSASALDKLTTEKEKISYMVGLDLANGVGQIKDEIDINIVIDAMKTQLAGGKLLMTAEESQAVRQSFMQKLQAAQQAKSAELAAKNKAEGDKFLADNKAKAGREDHGVRLAVRGRSRKARVKMPTAESTRSRSHYTGTKLDGTKFDSSVDRGRAGHSSR
jgi:FKBP-type peptidyl-prolyl cis-trans isomerase FkpA